jgi:hypothetical protein
MLVVRFQVLPQFPVCAAPTAVAKGGMLSPHIVPYPPQARATKARPYPATNPSPFGPLSPTIPLLRARPATCGQRQSFQGWDAIPRVVGGGAAEKGSACCERQVVVELQIKSGCVVNGRQQNCKGRAMLM